MFCTQCGTQIDPGKNFCKGCGARVGKAGEPSVNPAPSPAAAEPAKQPRPAEVSARRPQPMPLSPAHGGGGSNKTMIIAAGAAVVVLAAAAVYFATDLLRQPAPQETQVAEAPDAKKEEPPPVPAIEENKSPGEPNETSQSSLFEPIPPEPASPPPSETPKPAPEVAAKPAPRADVQPTPRRSQFKPAGQDPTASSRANRPPPAASASNRSATQGVYQTLRSTTLFESPSASSRVVANIPNGVRVNVVGSTGDWLEVHSRRGNPPGFIRRNDAQFIEGGP